MPKKKLSGSPRQKTLKSSKRGIPNLNTLKTEPLNQPYTLKLWPSILQYLEKNGGPNFVRKAILEKLQRILDEPVKAVCTQCSHLTRQSTDYFCNIILGYLDSKLLKQKFSCDYFQPRKDVKK